MLVALGGLLYLVSFGCGIFILIDAFKNEVWKGILCIVCGFYALYYALVEFEHEYKWQIIAADILCAIGGIALMAAGAAK
ncbi:MAG: hypothetical protein ABJA67_08530 [Chthonomonadales bacterium]